jgi:RNA polymerase sigma-70 factor (ECF subfamily)
LLRTIGAARTTKGLMPALPSQEAAVDADAAFTAVQRALAARFQRLAGQLLGSDADDALQEAWRQIHRALPGFRGAAQLQTYCHRVGLRALLHFQQKRARRAAREIAASDVGGGLDLATVQGFRDEPFTAASQGELRARVAAALQRLPEPLRAVLLLRHFEGLRYQDIAGLLDIPLGTVKSRMSAAAAALARRLQHEAKELWS